MSADVIDEFAYFVISYCAQLQRLALRTSMHKVFGMIVSARPNCSFVCDVNNEDFDSFDILSSSMDQISFFVNDFLDEGLSSIRKCLIAESTLSKCSKLRSLMLGYASYVLPCALWNALLAAPFHNLHELVLLSPVPDKVLPRIGNSARYLKKPEFCVLCIDDPTKFSELIKNNPNLSSFKLIEDKR